MKQDSTAQIFIASILSTSVLGGCGGGGDEAENLSNIVRISGIVKDATGLAIAAARVSYQFSDRIYSGDTDRNGRYQIDMNPAFVEGIRYPLVTIQKDGYEPAVVIYDTFRRGIEYTAQPTLPTLPANVSIPQQGALVWHLGDDYYGGSINSQFQKSADGRDLTFPVSDWAVKVAQGYKTATVSLMAKGVQSTSIGCANVFGLAGDASSLSGFTTWVRGAESPADGSWGNFSFSFPLSAIGRSTAGVRVITGRCANSSTDFDDFEIARIRVTFS